jgi:lipoprotein-anchoring transpeptidase ErfK/SrfK
MSVSRRSVLMGLPLLLAGCASGPSYYSNQAYNRRSPEALAPPIDPFYAQMYGPVEGEPFPVRPVDLRRVKPQFWRREVAYDTPERPGTIVVDPNERHLYLIQPGGRALRYGVGVGREESFNFQGEAVIGRKAEWPRWIPTPDMIAREPDRYGPYRNGMPGGEENPLGPRALYLYKDGKDTYYRLHGTLEPWTIGTMVSSGCIRLINQDVIDLYRRVPVGTKVVVLPTLPGQVRGVPGEREGRYTAAIYDRYQ